MERFIKINMDFVKSDIFTQISPSALKVYLLLKSYSDYTEKPVWPSIKTIEKQTGLSSKTVHKSLSELEKHGLIFIEPRMGNTNLYRFSEDKLPTHAKSSSPPPPIFTPTTSKNYYPNPPQFLLAKQEQSYQEQIKNKQQQEKDTVVVSLESCLEKEIIVLGINKTLVENHLKNGVDLDRIKLILFAIKKHRSTINNPSGYFCRAIDENWDLSNYEKDFRKTQMKNIINMASENIKQDENYLNKDELKERFAKLFEVLKPKAYNFT